MTFTVLQWNIWYKEDPLAVADFIKQIDPDIACLQEVTTGFHTNPNDVSQFLSHATGLEAHFVIAHERTTGDSQRGQGNCILSRFPIQKKSHHIVQEDSNNGDDDYSQEGRVITVVTIDIEGVQIVVGTTHLSYAHRFTETQQKQTEQNRLLEWVRSQSSPSILTGDFNVPPNSRLVAKLNKLLTHAGPPYDQNTWTTKPFDCHGFVETELNWRLDYVYATPDLKVIDSRIRKTTVSDHLPVLVTFEIAS